MIARAKTAEEYVAWVEQALVELEEVRACFEFEADSEQSPLWYLEPIEEVLHAMRKGMSDGSYLFADEDLPYMPLLNKMSSKIPFATILASINETHRHGLDINV